MTWFQKSMPIGGNVLFRGSLPPRAADVRLPPGATMTLRDTSTNPAVHWAADVQSPTLGAAEIVCPRHPPTIPAALLQYDNSLTDAELAEARLGKASVGVRIEQTKGNLLRDRKRLLTWLGALFDESGVIAVDHVSSRSWSRGMLDDELAHDADVDVSALYALHAVTADDGQRDDAGERRCGWLHSHGLAELGHVDFDVIRPTPGALRNGADLVRAIAYAVLEGRLKASGEPFRLFHPGGPISAIDAVTFDRRAPADERALRDVGPDDGGVHTRDRVVLVDPPAAKRRLFQRWFGGGVRASRAIQTLSPDRLIVMFSKQAGELAAQRALATWPQFAAIRDELADLSPQAIVKLRYRVDGGDADDVEHLWFEVHAVYADGSVDATLTNQPFQIAAMQQGQRGRHDVTSRMSDWQIMTPLGTVTPRSSAPLRIARTDPAARQQAIAMLASQRATDA